MRGQASPRLGLAPQEVVPQEDVPSPCYDAACSSYDSAPPSRAPRSWPPRRAARAGGPVNVAIQTSAGTIVVALDPARAPVTAKNFLHLVDTHAYDGASFYRTVVAAPPRPRFIEVIQGGLQDKAAGLTPIPIEPTTKTGLHNTQGTIAMARTADPNSATLGVLHRRRRRHRARRRRSSATTPATRPSATSCGATTSCSRSTARTRKARL